MSVRRTARDVMPTPPSLLGGMTVRQFLKRHWQKQPLCVRQALPGFRSFLTPDELVGLACEQDVNSRLVVEKGGTRPWQVTHGPLAAEDFGKLPRTHWTLLVTDIDKVLPPAADLLEHFTFIPGWRIDDLMISYAADRGGVGPHVDSYDVFLLQAHGRRRWQIDARAHGPDDFVPGLDLRVLGNFTAEREWVLEPGDMLYLPPGVAHFGVAEGECMTYSVGFRAPSHRELITDLAEHLAAQLDPDARYRDPDLAVQSEAGEISDTARRRVRQIVGALAANPAAIDDWLGRYLTKTGPWRAPEPRRRPLTPLQFRQRWENRGTLWRSTACRFALIRRRSGATLYADGQAFPLPRALAFAAPLLSGQRRFDFEALRCHLPRKGFVELLCDLYKRGYLSFKR